EGSPRLQVAVSPDGQRVLLASGNRFWLWNVATGLPTPSFDGHHYAVHFLQFSADGRRLSSGCHFATAVPTELLTWERTTWRLTATSVSGRDKMPNVSRLAQSSDHRLCVGYLPPEKGQ